MEARDEKRLLNLLKKLSRLRLLIIDELGFVPLSRTGAELLFEVFSQRHERGSILVTTNLPFDEWTEVFGSERLTGALLDRLTHHVHILENGESNHLKQSRRVSAMLSEVDPINGLRICGIHPIQSILKDLAKLFNVPLVYCRRAKRSNNGYRMQTFGVGD